MENKPLRERIEKYIAKEIALRSTPAYALSPKEMSYGLVNLVREELLEGLTVMTFEQSQILGLIPAQALLDYDRAKEVLEKVVQAQLDSIIKQLKTKLE